MDTLIQDLRIALRSLLRRPGFTLGAVVTLALGIGAATSIFSVVHGVLLRPLPYPDPDRVVRIYPTSRTDPGPPVSGGASPASLADWQERSRSFSAIAQYSYSQVSVRAGDEPEVMPAGVVTPELFRVLGSEPVLGRGFTAEENLPGGPTSIVISHGLWQERFGGQPDVLGQVVTLASGSTWQIVGVAPAGFDFPDGARLWFPLRPSPDCGRGCVYVNGIARLAPGVSLGQAQAEMSRVAVDIEAEFVDASPNLTLAVETLHDVAVGNVRTALWVLLGAVMLVVLIACANVANLLLVRGAGRSGELAVRAALGAGRARLVRQILTESVVLAMLGGVAGVLLALWGVSMLPALATANLPRVDEIGLDGTVVGFALGLVLLTAFLFGLVPALHLSRAPLATALRQGGRSAVQSPIRRAGRFTLLAAEVALSLVLLLGAGLLLRSFERLQSVDLGYDATNITHFSLSLPPTRYPDPGDAVRFYAELKERLAALPGVEQASFVSGMPLGMTIIATSFNLADRPPPEPGTSPVALLRYVDSDYFATMRIPLVRGRDFEPGDRFGTQPVAIISRQAAEQFWPGEDPLGRTISVDVSYGWPEDQPRTIVGIAENVRSLELQELAQPELYVPHAQVGSAVATLVMRGSARSGPLLAAARTEVRARDPLLAMLQPGTLRELVSDQLATSRFYMLVLSLFAVLAVTLAAVGIYSVVAYLVTRRTREIGVRMALGADPAGVIRSIVAQGLAPAAVGVAVGIAAAAAGSRVLASLLYETQPNDPLTYAGAALLLLAVVAAACALPAMRAAAISPTVALREE
jgi:putative ABC transport system permease protein